MLKSTLFYSIVAYGLAIVANMATAQDTTCRYSDPICLQSIVESEINTIENDRWKNQGLRDLAISRAYGGDIDGATTLITQINNGDTQAMTIRAIGMAVAIHQDLSDDQYRTIFKKLDDTAKTIGNTGARDIAYTYIAMAQAFADLDSDAAITAKNMTNPALKHKAYGETAEIQAEKGKYDLAIQSINDIDSVAFKNKALGLVSSIFLKAGAMENAYNTAIQITNPTKKADALQKIINVQIGLDQQ